jgi:hypothetical protein
MKREVDSYRCPGATSMPRQSDANTRRFNSSHVFRCMPTYFTARRGLRRRRSIDGNHNCPR